MTKPVETGANNGRCTLGGDCPIATNPHYHQTVPIVETGSKAQAECWTCGGILRAPGTPKTSGLTLWNESQARKHRALGHDVRTCYSCGGSELDEDGCDPPKARPCPVCRPAMVSR